MYNGTEYEIEGIDLESEEPMYLINEVCSDSWYPSLADLVERNIIYRNGAIKRGYNKWINWFDIENASEFKQQGGEL